MTTAPSSNAEGQFTLIGADGNPFSSPTRGTLGGHRGTKIYGRLDCRTALQAIANGGFVENRVFFLDTETATAAGFRPCANCMPDAYQEWRATIDTSDEPGSVDDQADEAT